MNNTHTQFIKLLSQGWLTFVIPVLMKLRQEDFSEFKASLGLNWILGKSNKNTDNNTKLKLYILIVENLYLY